MEEWERWLIDNLVEPVAYYQIVFTIPKVNRVYFRYNRFLMTDLSRVAQRAAAKFMELVTGEDAVPAMAVVKHTYCEGVRFYPLLHTIVTACGWLIDRTWQLLTAWIQSLLRELFQIEVFRFFSRRELLSRERMELIPSWHHSGFSVHISEAVAADDRESLTRVAGYML